MVKIKNGLCEVTYRLLKRIGLIKIYKVKEELWSDLTTICEEDSITYFNYYKFKTEELAEEFIKNQTKKYIDYYGDECWVEIENYKISINHPTESVLYTRLWK